MSEYFERGEFCDYVQLAIDREKSDQETGHLRGLYFDEKAADKVVAFFRLLKHVKGEKAGQPFHLEDYQEEHIIRPVFGWKKPKFEIKPGEDFDWKKHPYDPSQWVRRYNTAYLEVPKKTGKTTLCAGVGGYLLMADGESSGEVYSAAVKRDQAKYVHDIAKAMIRRSPSLSKRLDIHNNCISHPISDSKWLPLARDPGGNDGINPNGAIIDELHEWPEVGEALFDIIEQSTVTRENPLIFVITTAGKSKYCLCYRKRTYGIKVLQQVYNDDSFFAYICSPSERELEDYKFKEEITNEDGKPQIVEREAWHNPALWQLVSPSIGVTMTSNAFKKFYTKAANDPHERTSFKRYRLNIWCADDEEKMLSIDHWQKPKISFVPELIKGMDCYIGVDLSNRIDLTAVLAIIPYEKGIITIPKFWVPRESILRRTQNDNVPYTHWAEQGLIDTCPGNAVDYTLVKNWIHELVDTYNVKRIAIDPWNSGKFGQELQDDHGYEVVQVRQGYASLNDACKYLQELTLNGAVIHNNHDVLTWCASNVVCRVDPNGNIAPDKSKSEEKIDGISALVTGLTQLLKVKDKEDGPAVYPER